ncbi:hypothetical protein VPH35_040614 [Triticum aestivum]|uniref:Pentatricopeptide repeat-containing protein n=1 Tax=Aegilops tauschii subsp. strangulata TaxID=200361 RepID=A0A453D9G0_AEGTS
MVDGHHTICLVHAYAVARDMRGALSCVEEMKAEGIGLTIVTYSILISGFGKINDAQSADNLFKEAKTNLADLNGIIYSNIIHAHWLVLPDSSGPSKFKWR